MRCKTCPRRPEDGPCRGEAVVRLCQLHEADPGRYAPMLARASAIGEARPDAPQFRRAPGRINVGLIEPGTWAGGAERYHLQLWQHLDRSRFHVVGTALADAPDGSPLEADYRAVAPLAHGRDAMLALGAACDVVISWGLPASGLPEGACKRLVMVSHGRCDWTRRSMTAALRPECVAAVLVSEDTRRTLPGGLTAPVAVLMGMADDSRIAPAVSREAQRRAWGVPEGFQVALHVARPAREKRCWLGYRGLPEGWAYVNLGTYFDEKAVHDDARATAVGPAIFAGYQADIGSALAAADAALLPSDNEGCSLAALEYHLAGLPVVATPIGLYASRPDLIEPIPFDATPADVRDALGGLRTDPAKLGRARDYVLAEHSAAAFAARWGELLASVVPEPPTLARKAATFGKALARHVADGGRKVDDAERSRRLATCEACPDRRADGSCGRCGCALAAKARWRSESCPAGRW